MKKFFILALGRSGTNFLAELLSKDTNALIFHEPYEDDKRILFYRYAGVFDVVLDKMLKERFSHLIPPASCGKIYGEVNSYLRYEVDWLRANITQNLVFLTRDGRDFVKSCYVRHTFTSHDPQQSIIPKDDDPYAEKWQKLDRFEKLCWYWKHTNEYLFSKLKNPVQLEILLKDYSYFKEKILIPTGCNISSHIWEREIKKPKNTSKDYMKENMKRKIIFWRSFRNTNRPFPEYKNWDKELTNKFWKICGDTMAKLGYTEQG